MILIDLFSTLYFYIGFGIVFEFLSMIALPSIVETGLKQAVIKFWMKLCSDRQYLVGFVIILAFKETRFNF